MDRNEVRMRVGDRKRKKMKTAPERLYDKNTICARG
jgi:hypothetical protein